MKTNIFKKTFDKTKKKLAKITDGLSKMRQRAIQENNPDKAESFPKGQKQNEKMVVEISPASMAKSTAIVLLLILLAYFLNQISGILVVFFVAFLFSAALHPMVSYLQFRKLPRSVGVLLIYLLIFLVFGLLLSHMVPLIVSQIYDIARTVGQFIQDLALGKTQLPFSAQLKPYVDQFMQTLDLKTAAAQIQTTLTLVATQLYNISFGLINVILVLVLTFFMTVEEKSMEQFYLSLFPSKYGQYITTRLGVMKEKIGYWLRGQILLSFIAALLSYVGLLILGVQYALTLSVIAGIFVIIPVVGRVFAWVFTMPIVLNQSPILALWVSIYYFILQQIEVNILAPYVMNRVIGLSPIIIIFAMMVGYQYLGILGLVISIPIATTVGIFVKDYLERTK